MTGSVTPLVGGNERLFATVQNSESGQLKPRHTVGSMAAPPNEGLGLLREHIAAVLEHNGMTADEAFPFFDLDQDERLSVADLLESCAQANVNTSQPQVAAWIAHHARQDDKSFLTLSVYVYEDDNEKQPQCAHGPISVRVKTILTPHHVYLQRL